MFPQNRMILIACAVSLLAACGGGDSGSSSTPAPYVAPATYGANAANIWLQGGTYIGYNGSQMASNRSSQSEANAAAIAGCKTLAVTTNCVIVLEFGQNMCGAIARSFTATSGVYGTGVASSGAVAESIALADCKTNGGTNCLVSRTVNGVVLTVCNGTGTPSVTPVLASMLPSGSNSNPSVASNEEGLEQLINFNESK